MYKSIAKVQHSKKLIQPKAEIIYRTKVAVEINMETGNKCISKTRKSKFILTKTVVLV